MTGFKKTAERSPSSETENVRVVPDGDNEHVVRDIQDEPLSLDANSVEPGFATARETEVEAIDDDEIPSNSDFIFRIHSAVTGEDVRHRFYSHLGTVEEALGLHGIERLLEKHLGDENGPYNPDYALHFYRKMHDVMEGSHILIADIDDGSDVINIRIIRPGEEEMRFPNRFVLFESSGWWFASA